MGAVGVSSVYGVSDDGPMLLCNSPDGGTGVIYFLSVPTLRPAAAAWQLAVLVSSILVQFHLHSSFILIRDFWYCEDYGYIAQVFIWKRGAGTNIQRQRQ